MPLQKKDIGLLVRPRMHAGTLGQTFLAALHATGEAQLLTASCRRTAPRPPLLAWLAHMDER